MGTQSAISAIKYEHTAEIKKLLSQEASWIRLYHKFEGAPKKQKFYRDSAQMIRDKISGMAWFDEVKAMVEEI